MIALERRRWPEYLSPAVRIVRAKMSLPFVASGAGVYTHRVRSVDLITLGKQSHLAVGCWCSMTLCVSKRKRTRLMKYLPNDRPMCATCEGRAIGKDHGKINGTDVRYMPRAAKEEA